MRRFAVFSTLLVMALLVFRVFAQSSTEQPGQGTDAFATIINAERNPIGLVSFEAQSTDDADDVPGVRVTLRVEGLTPGFHGLHLHGIGSCEDTPEGTFQAAGPHYNPTGVAHPDHAGDFPVLLVTSTGQGYLSFVTDRFTVDELLDEDGSAVIIHADPDNFSNIPPRYGGPDAETLESGDSGAHIACGVLERAVDDTDFDDDDNG